MSSSAALRPASSTQVRASPPPASERAAQPAPAPAPAPAPDATERSSPARHLRAVPALTAPARDRAADPPSDGLIPAPPPQLIQRLALYAFEALEGTRAIAQLGGWVTPAVVQQLQERRAARTERRTLYHDERRIVATPGRAHIGRPLPHIIEATVVLYAQPRSCAVALRFEHCAGRWRATDLTVL